MVHAAPRADLGVRNEQHPVHERPERQRVGHQEDGGGVDDDEVRHLAQLHQELAHLFGLQQLGGAGGNGTRRHDPEVLHLRVLQGLPRLDLAGEHVRQAHRVLQIEEPVDPRLAEVGRNQDDPLVRVGQRHGEVGRRGGLALARRWAHDHEGLHPALDGGEHDAGSKRPVGLGDRALRLVHADQLRLLPLPPSRDLRDDCENPGAELLLEVGPSAEAVVQPLPQQRHAAPEGEADEEPQDAVQHPVRAGGSLGELGRQGHLRRHDLRRIKVQQRRVEVRDLLLEDLLLGLEVLELRGVGGVPRGVGGPGDLGDEVVDLLLDRRELRHQAGPLVVQLLEQRRRQVRQRCLGL